jgi:hypothetical protein
MGSGAAALLLVAMKADEGVRGRFAMSGDKVNG